MRTSSRIPIDSICSAVFTNNHVSFGGGGVHYCLGHMVAKAQLRALYSQILTKLPAMEVGEPVYLFSDFINGIKHLPVRV